jgi:hypothetical protein
MLLAIYMNGGLPTLEFAGRLEAMRLKARASPTGSPLGG